MRQQDLMDEPIQVCEAFTIDPKQIIRFPRQGPGADNLGLQGDKPRKPDRGVGAVACHLHLHKGLNLQTQPQRVEPGRIAGDQAKLFKPLPPASGLTGRKAKFVAQLLRGKMRITLQRGQKPRIHLIKFNAVFLHETNHSRNTPALQINYCVNSRINRTRSALRFRATRTGVYLMGPFPHSAPRSVISADNPAGTDGFEFVEFAHPEPEELRRVFLRMGYQMTARHKTKAVELWQQGDITYILNAEPGSQAMRFAAEHGPCAASMGWRVADAGRAHAHAVAKGALPYLGDDKALGLSAIQGIGGSLIYFTDQYGDANPYDAEFDWLAKPKPQGVGFYYLDHLTHNVHKGNMDIWFRFYGEIFGFKQIRFFDIEGKFSGLHSRALTSPCGRIRIPINEDRGEKGQIVEYLKRYNGEGIQHIAVGTENIYASTDAIHALGLRFMPKPPLAYYDQSKSRVVGHQEPLDLLEKNGILIDGEGVVDGGETRILLQIFSKTVIGPIFFEFIQRKGDDGFGEGNFKALFESIEADQIARGVLASD
jgi:4-hydroxyphenylpyruvate dioxygenase